MFSWLVLLSMESGFCRFDWLTDLFFTYFQKYLLSFLHLQNFVFILPSKLTEWAESIYLFLWPVINTDRMLNDCSRKETLILPISSWSSLSMLSACLSVLLSLSLQCCQFVAFFWLTYLQARNAFLRIHHPSTFYNSRFVNSFLDKDAVARDDIL